MLSLVDGCCIPDHDISTPIYPGYIVSISPEIAAISRYHTVYRIPRYTVQYVISHDMSRDTRCDMCGFIYKTQVGFYILDVVGKF